MSDAPITVEVTIDAPLDVVWSAWNTPADVMQWNAASDDWHTTASEVDLREGGRFSARMEAKDGSMGFDFAGTYTTVNEPDLIEYAFGDRNATITFKEVEGGTHVQITFDPEQTHPLDMQRDGWQAILNNFKRFTEAQ